MTARHVGGVLVVPHTKDDPSEEEWAARVELTVKLGRPVRHTFVVSEGGHPTTAQRKYGSDSFSVRERRSELELEPRVG